MNIDVFQPDTVKLMSDIINWIIRQASILIRRRRSELLEKKPGVVYMNDPTMTFLHMIHCVDRYTQSSKLDYIYGHCAKFNDQLNEAVGRIDQRMLTINSCNTSDHFDRWGNLSQRGKMALWYEVDDLLERFDEGKIKLLPAPSNKKKSHERKSSWTDKQGNRCHVMMDPKDY